MADAGYALGGLGSAVEGYEQAQQFKQGLETQKLQNRSLELQNAEKAIPYYQMIARQDNTRLNDPAFKAEINKTLQPLGISFDMTKPIPSDFTNPSFLNPDVWERTHQMGIDSFNMAVSRLMMSPNMPPDVKLGTIRTLAATTGVDASTLTQALESAGVFDEMQNDYLSRMTDLAAKAGMNVPGSLSAEKIREGAAMLPYRIQNEIAKTGQAQEMGKYYGARVGWMSSELQRRINKDSMDQAYRMDSLAIKIKQLQVQGARATDQSRAQLSSALTKAATEKRQTAALLLNEMNQAVTTGIGSTMSDADRKQAFDQAQQLLTDSQALTQAAGDMGNMPAYKPAPLAHSQQIKKPEMATGVVYQITAGKHKGMFVKDGKIGTASGGPVGAYTWDPSDKLAPYKP